jgi:hypothetical protein
MGICFSAVLDFDRFVYNIRKWAEFVKNLLKAMCLILHRLFRGRLLTGRIHYMRVSMVIVKTQCSARRVCRCKNRMLIV